MRDRDPALFSVPCPKCGEVAFRQGFFFEFIKRYLCYCEECGYQTKPEFTDHAYNIWVKQWDKMKTKS
jgi:uncharacterized Zn finger protein